MLLFDKSIFVPEATAIPAPLGDIKVVAVKFHMAVVQL